MLESIGDVRMVTETILYISNGEKMYFAISSWGTAHINQFKEEGNHWTSTEYYFYYMGHYYPIPFSIGWMTLKETLFQPFHRLAERFVWIEKQRNHRRWFLFANCYVSTWSTEWSSDNASLCPPFLHKGKRHCTKSAHRFCKEYRDSMGEDYKKTFARFITQYPKRNKITSTKNELIHFYTHL